MSRNYRYLEEAGITFAVDVQKGKARIALAACNPDDSFQRRTGRDVVDTLLDCNDSTLLAFQLKRNVVSFPYDNDKPIQHIMKPMLDFLADELGERIFFRQLLLMFMNGITTKGIAAEVAQQVGDEAIYYKFKKLTEVLDPDSLDLLETLEDEHQFYKMFFSWRGSVDCIMGGLRHFASEVYTRDILLEDAPPKENKPKKVAPRRPEPERAVAATPVKIPTSKEKPVTVEK